MCNKLLVLDLLTISKCSHFSVQNVVNNCIIELVINMINSAREICLSSTLFEELESWINSNRAFIRYEDYFTLANIISTLRIKGDLYKLSHCGINGRIRPIRVQICNTRIGLRGRHAKEYAELLCCIKKKFEVGSQKGIILTCSGRAFNIYNLIPVCRRYLRLNCSTLSSSCNTKVDKCIVI